jgi:hypothetical protein
MVTDALMLCAADAVRMRTSTIFCAYANTENGKEANQQSQRERHANDSFLHNSSSKKAVFSKTALVFVFRFLRRGTPRGLPPLRLRASPKKGGAPAKGVTAADSNEPSLLL